MAEIKTIRDLLINSAEHFSKMTALSMGDKSITYQALKESSESIESYLMVKGVKKRTKIALLSENRPEWGIAFFGIANVGATVVVMDPILKSNEIKFILNNSETSYIFVSGSFIHLIQSISYELPNLKEVISLENLTEIQGPMFIPVQIEPDDDAILIYTSGTMGSQKGVVLSHQNIITNLQSAFQEIPYKPGTKFLSLLPLSHMLEITVGFLGPLYNGGCIIYPESFKSYELLETMRKTQTEIIVVVPLMLKIFYNGIRKKIEELPEILKALFNFNIGLNKFFKKLKIDISRMLFKSIHDTFGGKLKYFICGGAPLDAEIEDAFDTFGIPVLLGYGLTETSPVVGVNTLKEKRRGSVGKPLPGMEVRIEKDGEIVVRGPNVMKGYYKNENATKEIIKDGWLYTGDIGEINRDGFIFIKGRKKNVIVTKSGLKIFSEEVESLFTQSPYIKEICVVERDGRVHAVVYPDYSFLKGISNGEVEERLKQEIDKYQKEIAHYKRVQTFEIWQEELPKTTTRKIKRQEISQRLRGSIERKKFEEMDHFASKVRKVVAKVIKIPPTSIKYNSSFSQDLGVDSLMKIEILCEVDKKFGIYIPEEQAYEIENFKNLVDIIKMFIEAPGTLKQNFIRSEIRGDLSDLLKESRLLKCTRLLTAVLLFCFTRIYFKLRVKGKENIPPESSFIIASNHTSLLDFPLIYTSLPRKKTRDIAAPAAKDYFFKSPLKELLVRMAFNAFPLERFGNFFEGLKACARVISTGKPLVLFPEGTRSLRGTLQPFKLGIGLLAFELNVPILPTFIKGVYEVFPKGKIFPKSRPIEVIFGKSMRLENYKKLEGKITNYEIYKMITEELRKRILELMETPKP